MFDIIIKNGLVIDGSGAPAVRADVGILGDLIAAVGELDVRGERIIDAEGRVVCPGFIDCHSHTDHSVLLNPTCESKATQGVTTELSGNCGESTGPGGASSVEDEYSAVFAARGIKVGWGGVGEFLGLLDGTRMSINFATLVGHGSIRGAAMGYGDRPPTDEELLRMKSLLREAMEAGAFGLSSGLIYPPGCYASTEELVELSRTVAEYGGIYASHIRDEGEGLLAAVEEAVRIGREAGPGVQLSHHKAFGRKSWGLVKQSLAMIDEARAAGLDVWADQYPYTATATGLGTMLPTWAHDGGTPALLRRLSGRNERLGLREQMMSDTEDGVISACGGWQPIVISFVHKERNRWCEGLNMEEIARRQGKHPVDATLDLMLDENGSVGILRFVLDEEDVSTVMRHPSVLIGSDSTARATTGPTSNGRPHPRSFGTFARVLGRYVREEGVLALEDAVARMTGRTARRFGMRRRGLIRENFYADVTVFDPEAIIDTATYQQPHSAARGIDYVLVNGGMVVDGGRLLDIDKSAPGRVLRRGDA